MRIIVTAGPTREYIDTVRFITNASSGRMGCAVADAAIEAGHQVTLVLGIGATASPGSPGKMDVVRFTTVAELKGALDERFESCDALVMAAAVGDFRPEETLSGKLRRREGPVALRLLPTDDILAGLGRRKRGDQRIIAFAVEEGPPVELEAKARAEMAEKNADFVVVNTPSAMAAEDSHACILSRQATVLPWADRPKQALAREIVRLLG